jgi:hypothetical protein
MTNSLRNEDANASAASSSSAPTSVGPQTQRLRFTVPAADLAVQEWIDAQDKWNLSVRGLIRESIERDGFVDFINRPVRQQPRRGRPSVADDADEQFEQPEAQRETAPLAPAPVAHSQPEFEPEQSAAEQVEVSDLFGSLRN